MIETRQTIRVHGRVVSKTLSIDRPPLWPVLGIDRLPSKRPGSGRYTTSSAVVTPLHIVLGGYRLINYHNDANAYFLFWLALPLGYLSHVEAILLTAGVSHSTAPENMCWLAFLRSPFLTHPPSWRRCCFVLASCFEKNAFCFCSSPQRKEVQLAQGRLHRRGLPWNPEISLLHQMRHLQPVSKVKCGRLVYLVCTSML